MGIYIYKCTARDFTKDNVEGYLLNNGKIQWEPINSERRNRTTLNRSSCRKCKILPICNGGCSQKRLETLGDQCVYNFDDESKLAFAKKIIYNKLQRK